MIATRSSPAIIQATPLPVPSLPRQMARQPFTDSGSIARPAIPGLRNFSREHVAAQYTPRRLYTAAALPQFGAADGVSLGHIAMETVMNLSLICLWGGVLFMSFQAITVYTTASSAAVSAAPMAMPAAQSVAVEAAPLGVLFLRGFAATLGVAVSGTIKGIASIPGVAFNIIRPVFFAIFGTLLHLI